MPGFNSGVTRRWAVGIGASLFMLLMAAGGAVAVPGSSGSDSASIADVRVERNGDATVVTLMCDTGLKYLSTALYVGEQVLDNDDANAREKLDSYMVVYARLSWSPRGSRGSRRGGFTLFVEARNLFDEQYTVDRDYVNGLVITRASYGAPRTYGANLTYRF